MKEIAEYLLKHYYPHYKGTRTDVVPDYETLLDGLVNHRDKVMVIRNDNIKGVAVFLTLYDTTYEVLDRLDITDQEVLVSLLDEKGMNVHVVLIAADGYSTMRLMRKEIRNKMNPDTVSWWNQDLTKLHRYKLRR